MGTKIALRKFEPLEPGLYKARIGAAAMEKSNYNDAGEQVALRFDLIEEGVAGKSIRAWANPTLSTSKKGPTKLYTWISTLLFGGRPIPDGYVLDLDDLLDREVIIEVTVKDSGYNGVGKVLPIRAALPTVKAQPAPVQNAQPPALSTRAAMAPEPPDLPGLSDDQLALADPGPEEDDGIDW